MTSLGAPSPADQRTRPVAESLQARRLSSEQLFAGFTEIEIEHGSALYRLKQTSLGKLILTK